jgi:hypothetical protein
LDQTLNASIKHWVDAFFERKLLLEDPATLSKIESVLKQAGIDFIEENGGGPGVRLRNTRQLATRK